MNSLVEWKETREGAFPLLVHLQVYFTIGVNNKIIHTIWYYSINLFTLYILEIRVQVSKSKGILKVLYIFTIIGVVEQSADR